MDDTELAAALHAADGGDFRPATKGLSRLLERQDIASVAARIALETAAHLADVDVTSPLTAGLPRLLEQCVAAPPAARAAAQWACVYLEKKARLRFDTAELARLVATHAKLVEDGEVEANLWFDLARAWQAVISGELRGEVDQLETLARRAREAKLAGLVVEATSLRALCLASAGNIEPALETARRGSRMARTEGLPQAEYLANVILARLRRLSDRPHLATRILSALSGFASSAWREWIRWELVMASGQVGAGAEAVDENEPAARLSVCLAAAATGDHERFASTIEALSETTQHFALLREDVERVCVALDFCFEPPTWTTELKAFRQGTDARVPFGLEALNLESSVHGQPAACVIAFPEGGVRVLHGGTELAINSSGAVRLPSTRAATGRTDTLLAALSLAGNEGLTDSAAFHAVYGFAFAKHVHQDAFNVVVHRARQRLGDYGELEHQAAHLRLHIRAPIVIADPRCKRPIDERVLQVVAQHGAASAQTVAKELDVPLRRVQDALKQLVDLGACAQEAGKGRQYAYRVEDTTFLVPTRFR